MTWYFSPAMSGCTGTGTLSGVLGFTLVMVVPGDSKKNES